MVKMDRKFAGMYETNIIAVNTLNGVEEKVTITRFQNSQRLWNLNPLTEKLESRSECKNLLSKLIKGTKKFDEWILKYDPEYQYSKRAD